MDTVINPRAVAGNNEPPLAERLAIDHADLVKRSTEAAALVPETIRAIETDDEAAAYTDTAADIKAVIADADAAFTTEKAPWLTGGRTVDDFFAFRKTLGAAVKRVTGALDTRANAILAAQRKAEAAAAEKVRKEAEAFDEEPVYVPPAPVREAARVVSFSTGNRASVSTKWTHRVVDPEKVPRRYLMVNEAALKAAVAGGTREIEGVEIFEAAKTAIRR